MAIDDLLDEHEQSEKVRNWLQRNAVGIIGGVLLGLALVGGWRWWQARAEGERIQAGEQYQAALKSLQAKDLKSAQAQIVTLKSEPYATLAALDLAKAQVAAGQRDAAIAGLRNVKPSDSGLAQIRSQRLARLLIDAGKGDEALQLLATAEDTTGLEVRGDALFALGRREQAQAAYLQALTKVDVASPQRRLLELKLSEAGGTPPKPGAPT
jgi:predicted negative regulator of RcsB-dependent stress response